MIRFFSTVEFLEADDQVIDVHSFKATERLQVHIDRQEADTWSMAKKAQPAFLNLRVYRSASRKVA